MKHILILLILWTTNTVAQNHALVIGCCSKYIDDNLALLKGTSNDAKHIKRILLERAVSSENMDYLVEQNATYKNITSKVKALENSSLKKGDTLYMYYSGHGTSAQDRSVFGNKLADDEDILNRLNNSTGLIPYDFDMKNPNDTLIITSRDIRPTFERLDKRGINIVWIVDACYAGNADRSTAGSSVKRVNLNTKELQPSTYLTAPNYKHLLFYGATLTDIMTEELWYKNEYRGEFSVAVVNCLEKNYGKAKIRNKDFKHCLESDYDPFVFSSAIYPTDNQREEQVIIKASSNPIQETKNALNHKEKLFALKNGKAVLKLNIYSSDDENRAVDTFCMEERLSIDLKERVPNVVAFTLDIENKLIILYPNKDSYRANALHKIIKTDVCPPAGEDRIKVFTIQDDKIYDSIFKYRTKREGVLSEAEAEIIYNLLHESNAFHSALVKVTTVDTNIRQCLKGDR